MQIQVGYIEADVPRPDQTDHRIQIRTVVVAQSAGVVNDGCDFPDMGVEDPNRIRIRQHQPRRLRSRLLPQVLQIDHSVFIGHQFHHPVAGHGSAGRIRAVGGIRNQNLIPFSFSPGFMISPDQQKAGEFSLGSRSRLEGHPVHSGDCLQIFLQCVDDFRAAGHRLRRLQRMNPCESFQSGHPFIQQRIMLHGAGAQRIETVVQSSGLPGQRRVVPVQFIFRDFRQPGRRFPHRYFRQTFLHITLREQGHPSSRHTSFENQFHHACTSFPGISFAASFMDSPGAAPSRRPESPESVSATIAAARSMSSFVFFSVAHHRIL